MSYANSTLVPGENIIYRARLHWIMYLPHLLLMCICIGFITIIPALLRQTSTEMVITNKRLILKGGLISRKTLEINLNKIESVSVNQSFLGRMFGYGDISIIGSGGTKETFTQIADPIIFRKKFTEQSSNMGK